MYMELKKFLNVLIVDDEEIDQIIAVRLIEKLQLTQQIDVVSNGQLAFDFIREGGGGTGGRHTLILLDINMPIMNGFTFLDKCKQVGYLKEDYGYVQIILLTSSIHPEDRKKAASYGVRGYIIKPLTADKLLNAISSIQGGLSQNR